MDEWGNVVDYTAVDTVNETEVVQYDQVRAFRSHFSLAKPPFEP